MKLFKLSLLLLIVILSSCNTSKKIIYLQDVEHNKIQSYTPNAGIVIQPKDMISIVVSSRVPELVAPLNLPVVQYQAGGDGSMSGSQRILGYSVDSNGEIDFPQLGKMKLSGMTRWQVSENIKKRLIEQGVVNDPVVIVQFMNLRVSILGEVKSPGSYPIEGDQVTLLDAISKAGDLTIHGVRDNVTVIREKNGQREVFTVDIRSKELFNSPVYYLQQNDVVYVQPNGVRAGQSNINENNFKSVAFWMSAASFITSMIVLFATRL